jgi:serine/threonine protein kinase
LEKVFSSQRRQKNSGPFFSPEHLLGVYRGVAFALGEMHRRGMAHLDIKMCNIMGPRADFSSRLIDFGLCSLQEGPQNEVLKITLDTRDPVVFQGKECFTWSDIWSIGVIFSDLVSEKRFSIIPYYQPGFWPDGKKFDWTKEETKLSLKFIEERVNDHDLLEPFLHTLDMPVSKLTVGTAYIISGCLWKNPGKRSSLGFQTIAPGLEKWPFPVFTWSSQPSVTQPSFKYPVKETHRGHVLLDGSGPFVSTSEIPDLSFLRHAVSTSRKYQLQFIASLLSDLREFNVKTFLLSVDILDRVSSPKVRDSLKFENSRMNLIALETACVYFALLQSCAWEPSLSTVLDRALENLPWRFCESENPETKKVLPRMWDLFLSLLSTVKFQQSWDDSLWSMLVSTQKHKNPNFIKGLLEGLLTWPNGTTTCSEFFDGLLTSTSSYLPPLGVKKISFPAWITPEFNQLISASPFLDVFVVVTPLEIKERQEPDEKKELRNYLENFKSSRTHPFWIPLPPLKGLSRQDFLAEVDMFMKDVTIQVPKEACEGKKCIVCLEASISKCSSCELWSLCEGCIETWKGRCSQCLFPEEVEEWKTRTFFKCK